ncbi:MAG: FAD:protein FMN transferase [Candidatus Omnitrophota bacterium]
MRKNDFIKIFLVYGLWSMACGLICGCSPESELTQQRILMGTNARITIVPDSDVAQLAMKKAFDLLEKYEGQFSFYDQKSELTLINNNAAKYPVKLSPGMFDILRKALEYSKNTKGAFDPTATSLQAKDGYGTIILDPENKEVYFNNTQTKVDLGGITVGFCLDLIVEEFKALDIKNFLIDIGGDIYAQGKNKQGKNWGIGISDPFDESNILENIFVSNCAVTTSGNYIKKHIVNTVKAETSPDSHNEILSVTVIADKCIDADVLATAFFIMGLERTELFLKNKKNIEVLFIMNENNTPKIVKLNCHQAV